MKFVWIQSSIRSNKLKTVSLIILFPVFIFVILLFAFWIEAYNNYNISKWPEMRNYIFTQAWTVLIITSPIILIRFLISFTFHRNLIFKFSWAKPISRKEAPELYNIVENLCISRGITTPQIWIIEDESMNAFATGWKPNKSRIVFSRWILNRLNKQEIEAVAWHELTHILNKDTLLMVCIVVFIWIIGTLWEILIRSSGSIWKDDKDNGKAALAVLLIWISLMVIGYLIFPLIRMSISRKREYLADAGSVELTKNNEAMISALEKISTDSRIESIKKQTVAAMCIENPFKENSKKKVRRFQNLLHSHPSIENRIEALKNY